MTYNATCICEEDIKSSDKYDPELIRFGLEHKWSSPEYIFCYPYSCDDKQVEGYFYRFNVDVEMADIGEVDGLGSIKNIMPRIWTKRVTGKKNNGYIVRIKYRTVAKYLKGVIGSYIDIEPSDRDYSDGLLYARFFIDDLVYSQEGEHVGFHMQIHYPFNPT